MLFALDVSKASSHDGLGSYTRGLLRALSELETEASFRLLNLLGAATATELQSAIGEQPPHVEVDLERWQEKTPDQQAQALAGVEALLATSWTVPAAAPPSLFVVYDLTFLSHPQCHTLSNRLHCAEGLLRAKLRGDAFSAISNESAVQLENYFGVKAADVLVAEPAVGDAFRRPEDDLLPRIRERHGLGEIAGYVLCVGSLEPRKNVERLLDAHELLPEATKRAYPLVLVGGKGWRNTRLEERIRGADPAQIRHLGAVSEANLVDLFGAATVFVYPSLAEGFGLPVLEAMACGAPVITSSLSSLPEVAGEAAVLVDPLDTAGLGEAMENLLNDPPTRRELSRQGLERVGHFSWSRTAQRLLSGLETLTARKAPR